MAMPLSTTEIAQLKALYEEALPAIIANGPPRPEQGEDADRRGFSEFFGGPAAADFSHKIIHSMAAKGTLRDKVLTLLPAIFATFEVGPVDDSKRE